MFHKLSDGYIHTNLIKLARSVYPAVYVEDA